MAKSETRSSKPKKETSTRSTKAGARETPVSKGIKKAAKVLDSPIVRNMVAAGIETAVATRTTKKGAGKGAQAAANRATGEGSRKTTGGFIEAAVVAVASEAARRIAVNETGAPSGGQRASSGGKASDAQAPSKPKSLKKAAGSSATGGQAKGAKSGSKDSGRAGTKKASSGTGGKSAASKGAASKSGPKPASRSTAGTKKASSKAKS